MFHYWRRSKSPELRLKVADPAGLGVEGSVELSSNATQFHRTYSTNASGGLTARTQYGWGKNTAAVSADGAVTDRYLNPPVIQNYINTAPTADFAVRYERELTNHDRVGVILRRGFSKFLVPDEQLQYAARQRQHRENFETLGILSYQHVFSSQLLADLHFSMRYDTDRLQST